MTFSNTWMKPRTPTNTMENEDNHQQPRRSFLQTAAMAVLSIVTFVTIFWSGTAKDRSVHEVQHPLEALQDRKTVQTFRRTSMAEEEEEEGVSLEEEEVTPSIKSFQDSIFSITRDMLIAPIKDFDYDHHRSHYPHAEKICEKVRALPNRSFEDPPLLLNMTDTSCRDGINRGMGNTLHHWMDDRLVAFSEGRTALIRDCGPDAFEERGNLIGPWLSGYFPPSVGLKTPFFFDKIHEIPPYENNVCPWPQEYIDLHQTLIDEDSSKNNNTRKLVLPLKDYYPIFQHELRRMAVALVGVPKCDDPENEHPSAIFERDYLVPESENPPYSPTSPTGIIHRVPIHDYFDNGPVFSDVEIDDVAIHYRCGDVLHGACCYFTYTRFEEFAKLISPDAKTIGIVTQPFEDSKDGQSRPQDKLNETGDRCKALVHGLIDYLKPKFPNAKFAIRNGPGENMALAFARMVMANQTIALTPSTFSIFPLTSSFGTGYFANLKGRQNNVQYAWIEKKGPQLVGTHVVHIPKENRIAAEKINELWESGRAETVLKWFRDENFDFE